MVLVALFSAMIYPAKAQAPTPIQQACPTDVRGMLECYSKRYGAKIEETSWIIGDESGFSCRPSGLNDHGRAFGPAQYHKDTFYRHAALMGVTLDYYSCHDQIKLFAWIFGNTTKEKCEWTKYGKKYCG